MPTRQHNVQPHGPLSYQGDSDLTDKENFIVTRTATGVALPSADTDDAFGVVDDGKATDSKSSVIPFVSGHQFRVKCAGAVAEGDKVCPDGANPGRVKKALSGDKPFATAEEEGVADQDLLVTVTNSNETLA